MKLIKKILFPLFSLFLFYQTFELVKQVLASGSNAYSHSEILTVALLLVLFITGVFAFPGFAYPTSRLMPANYYKIKNAKHLERLYRLLGIRYFRVFLLVFFWGWKKNKQKYFNGTRNGLQNFVYQTKQSEFGHLCAFVIVLMVSLILLIYAHLLLFALLTLVNVLGNLYPVVLQRYHRIRIEKLLQ